MKLFGFKRKSKKDGSAGEKKQAQVAMKTAENIEDAMKTRQRELFQEKHPEEKQPISQQTIAVEATSNIVQQVPAQTTALHNNDSNNNQNASTVTDLPVGDPALATPDVTRNLVKKFISDIWNRGDIDLIPRVCSPKIRFNGMSGLDKIGHEGFARMVATIHGAFSDYHCEIHSMVVENNKAFCRLRFSGKFTGPLMGYRPHGKAVAWMGASEFTCSNGVILKVWELGDMKTLEEQLANGPM